MPGPWTDVDTVERKHRLAVVTRLPRRPSDPPLSLGQAGALYSWGCVAHEGSGLTSLDHVVVFL